MRIYRKFVENLCEIYVNFMGIVGSGKICGNLWKFVGGKL